MSYNNKIDIGKIIYIANRKERENWVKINEYCKLNKKYQEELVREAFVGIKKYNKAKFDKINDPNTSDGERAAILTEYIITKILMGLI